MEIMSEKHRKKEKDVLLLNERMVSMQQQLSRYAEEEKEREMELQELRKEVKRLKLQHLDTTKYAEWGPEEIVSWILSLDGGRYMKYEEALRRNLKEEEVDGSMLDKVNSADLKGWGIVKFADKKHLEEQIGNLVANPNRPAANAAPMMANEGAHAATAFL